jgi:hypothetical protein
VVAQGIGVNLLGTSEKQRDNGKIESAIAHQQQRIAR